MTTDLSAGPDPPHEPQEPLEPRGSRALQISNAVGRVHKQLVGRGPTNVRTHINQDYVLCLLEGGLTQAERTISDHAADEVVIEIRLRLQHAMRAAILQAVEAIVGRRVRSFMSSNDPRHNVQAELMLLEPETAPG